MRKILTGILTLLLLLGSSKAGWGQSFSMKFLDIPSMKKTMSATTVSSNMIEVLKQKEVNEELQAFLSELSFLQILTFNASSNTGIKPSYLYRMAINQLEEYAISEKLLSINDGHRQTLLAAINKTADNKVLEIVFINCDENSFTIINITGNISIGKLGNLSKLRNSIKNTKKL